MTGMTVVFVHGVPETGAVWQGVRAHLDGDTIAVDLPGFGTPRPAGFGATKDEYARWLLIRRSVADPEEVAYFACGGPPDTELRELVRVAGARWAVEDLFELAKGDCGLDEYEVRSWVGWHRHVTLSLFALAVVAVIQSRVAAGSKKKGGRADPVERPGGPQAAAEGGLGVRTAGEADAGLVGLAASAPAPSPGQPLPEAAGQAAR